MSQHNNHASAGFTLIEMLVVAPIALLAIGGFIALMVSMVGDVLATRDYNTMVYNSQDSLNRIEQDVRLSVQFLTTTGTTSPQQGSDNNYSGTAPFTITSNNNMLILSVPATDKNPVDSSRQVINYANQPNPCGTSQTANAIFATKIVYFINNGSLWRRTILPPYDTNGTPDNNTVCSQPWQQNSCFVGYVSDGHCQTNDAELMKNVQSLTIQYFADPASTVDVGVAGASTATTLSATITGVSNTAGRSASTSQSVRVTKLNSASSINGSTAQTPLAVTMQPSSKSVVASDTNITIPAASSIPSASVLWQQSSDNGTTWQDMPGQSSATLLLQSIDMSWNNRQFRAVFSSGGSSVTTNTATLTVTLWGTLSYQGGWGESYVPPTYTGGRYTKTSAGLVMLKGLVSGGTTTTDTVIATLPIGYRPSYRMIFYVGSYNTTATAAFGRVDVLTNGEVHFMSGNNTWVSLDSIKFLDTAATCTATTNLTLSNNWKNYAGYSPLNLCKDTTGRIETNGLVYGGTITAGTTIGAIPAGYQPPENLIVPAVDGTGIFGSIGIYPSAVVARGMMTNYLSVSNSYVANNGAVTWQTPTIVNGMTPYSTPAFPALQYGKTSDGLVMLKGLMQGGTVANGTTVFTLPSGFRPSSHMLLSSVAYQHHARIDINTDGTVVIQGAGDTTWMSFDALSFWSDGS